MERFLTFKISQDNPELQILFQSLKIKLGCCDIIQTKSLIITSSNVPELKYSPGYSILYVYGWSNKNPTRLLKLPEDKEIKTLFNQFNGINNTKIELHK